MTSLPQDRNTVTIKRLMHVCVPFMFLTGRVNMFHLILSSNSAADGCGKKNTKSEIQTQLPKPIKKRLVSWTG